MQGKIFNCADDAEREEGMNIAVKAAQSGRLVVMPTDTLYGLGCDAFDNDAVANLLATKQRGPDMPVPVLVGSWAAAEELAGDLPEPAVALMKAYWPGGLSVVVPQSSTVKWNLGETSHSVMLRMPLNAVALDLLRLTGPLGVSSANITAHAQATDVTQAEQQLGESVSIYLDGGPADSGTASTIVDVTCEPPRIIREGTITAEDVARSIGTPAAVLRREKA